MKSLFGSQPKTSQMDPQRVQIFLCEIPNGKSQTEFVNAAICLHNICTLVVCSPHVHAKLLPVSSIDSLTIPSRGGKGVLRRITEVFDCWFESGSMPYAQAHYPFENKKEFEDTFPADFIAEGIDQTRGW